MNDATPIPREAEELYRRYCRIEPEILEHPERFTKNVHPHFALGARWGMGKMLALLGHEEWAAAVHAEEVAEYTDKPKRRRFTRTIRRILVPGSMYDAIEQ